jgi:hypothetical protein
VALAQNPGADASRRALLEQALRARSSGDFATALTLVLRAGELQWSASTRRFATEMLIALSRGEEAVAMSEACLRDAATSDNRNRETHLRACYQLRDQARTLAAQQSPRAAQTTTEPTAASGVNASVSPAQSIIAIEPVRVNASLVIPTRRAPFCCTGGLVTVGVGAASVGVAVGLWTARNDLLRNCVVDANQIQCDSAMDVTRAQGAAPLHWASVGLTATGMALMSAGAVWSIASALVRARAARSSISVWPMGSPGAVGVVGTF